VVGRNSITSTSQEKGVDLDCARQHQDPGTLGPQGSAHDIEFFTIGEDFSARALTGVLDAANALEAQRLSVCADDPDRARLIASFPDALDVVVAADRENGGSKYRCAAPRIRSNTPAKTSRQRKTSSPPFAGRRISEVLITATAPSLRCP
jgi:hypothetical protein